ncbi:MAG: toll/interleukin-1 receptor domain-containing protein [Clostridia bacterium]|nr:toll/interleukin-1 receptor domain-containing protein [Clostridia bacterium]
MRTQIFISYRRDGGLEAAREIYDFLHDKYEVFYDNESLRNGKFDIAIEDRIKQCSDFILILSKQIFERFENEGDWISRELGLALEHSKNIIPIFLDGFEIPVTNNKTVLEVMRYNGIKYSAENFYDKLALFLVSNKKCVLDIECDDKGYKLGESAIETLKEVYRRTRLTKNYGVHVVLNLPDLDVAAERLVSAELSGNERDIAIKNKKLKLIRKHQKNRDKLELAIEFMIGDTCNVEQAPLYELLKDIPLAKEHYFDENGAIESYYSVCVWVKVIEELLKEITLESQDRYFERANNRRDEYIKIDCIRWDRPQWSFTTFAKRSECNESVEYYQINRPSPFTLSAETVLYNILPDFYYKVAHDLLYRESEMLHKDLMNPECTIRILECYWFGLS